MPDEALVYALLVGAVLEQLRQRKGLMQMAFAKQANLTQSTLSRIERGRAHPKPHELARMAKLLAISPAELTATVDAAFGRLEGAVKVIMGRMECSWTLVLSVVGPRGLAGLAAFAAAATLQAGGPDVD